MVSYNAPDSIADISSTYSDWAWDSGGYWVRSRYDPSGRFEEYEYRHSETSAQNTKQDRATPRTQGADYIVSPGSISHGSFSKGSYQNQGAQVQGRHTTNPSTSISYQATPSYQHTPSTLNSGGGEYDSSSLSGTTQGWTSSVSGHVSSQQSQNYDTADLAGRLRGLTINTTVPAQQQCYAPPIVNQPNMGKQISRGTSFTAGELDDRYKVVEAKNQQKFWKVGRVFMVLWTEPAGIQSSATDNGTQYGSQFCTTYLNGTAYTEIRRFVVIGEGYGNSICSPIHTYSGQATLKNNLPDPKQHAIIHTSKRPPEERSYTAEDGTLIKENLPKEPIRVTSEQAGDEGDLGDRSRVNYAKIYTVEHYVRVLNIGKVHPNSMSSLEKNCMFIRRSDEPPQPPRGQSSSSRRESSKKKSSTKPSSSRKLSTRNDE